MLFSTIRIDGGNFSVITVTSLDIRESKKTVCETEGSEGDRPPDFIQVREHVDYLYYA